MIDSQRLVIGSPVSVGTPELQHRNQRQVLSTLDILILFINITHIIFKLAHTSLFSFLKQKI